MYLPLLCKYHSNLIYCSYLSFMFYLFFMFFKSFESCQLRETFERGGFGTGDKHPSKRTLWGSLLFVVGCLYSLSKTAFIVVYFLCNTNKMQESQFIDFQWLTKQKNEIKPFFMVLRFRLIWKSECNFYLLLPPQVFFLLLERVIFPLILIPREYYCTDLVF